MKGGVSTTSIVIEDSDACFRFWLSANEGVAEATIKFVSGVLKLLATSIESDEAQVAIIETRITQECVDFAKNRVSNYRNRLRNFSRACRSHLESNESLWQSTSRSSPRSAPIFRHPSTDRSHR